MIVDAETLARFEARVAKQGGGSCWRWIGSTNPNGYGVFRVGRRSRMSAHRFALIIAGVTILPKQDVDHVCRTRGCVNPAHLRAISHRENVLAGDCPMALNARKTSCPAGHPYAGANLYVSRRGERKCRECDRLRAREVRRLRRQKGGKGKAA